MEDAAKGFRSLHAWQMAYELTLDIYRLTKKFPKDEMYGLTSQLQRAAISIPANIAEGYERNHKKEYQQFLFIAKGSLGEVETLGCSQEIWATLRKKSMLVSRTRDRERHAF